MTARPAATPARFDASVQRRRSLIAKVHIAKSQIGLEEDDYRAVLIRVTGHSSARDCSDAELVAAVEAFGKMGFTARASGKPRAARPADHKSAGKARAMWISLYQLGAINDSSEAALEAFARRQIRCDRLQWANQAMVYKLVEALKAMAARHGWDQSSEGVAPTAKTIVLKRRLVTAILDKLKASGLAPADWTVQRAARTFAGIDMPSLILASLTDLDACAQAFGRVLRDPIRPLSAVEIMR